MVKYPFVLFCLEAAEPPYPVTPQEQLLPPLSVSPSEEGDAPHPEEEDEGQNVPGPSARTLERYLNDSLHAWFRQEFLMEYEAEAGRLLCMVCGGELPSLHLDHIKSHVLDTHPNSLVYSSEEKHCILQAWAQTHGEKTISRSCSKYELIQPEVTVSLCIKYGIVIKECGFDPA